MDDKELLENLPTIDGPTDTAAAQSMGAMSSAQLKASIPDIPDAADVAQTESFDDLAPARRSTYVRQRAPRRTQEAIDDLAEDDNPVEYAHESNIAVGGVLGDGRYRRARSEISRFQRNNRYGQYLQVPKGRRSIFAKRERSRRRQSAIAAIVVIGILAIAAYVVWQIMTRISFG